MTYHIICSAFGAARLWRNVLLSTLYTGDDNVNDGVDSSQGEGPNISYECVEAKQTHTLDTRCECNKTRRLLLLFGWHRLPMWNGTQKQKKEQRTETRENVRKKQRETARNRSSDSLEATANPSTTRNKCCQRNCVPIKND